MSELGPLVGEPLAIDLVNSRASTPEGEIDFLETVPGLSRWLDCERERLAPLSRAALDAPTKADLAAVRTVRDQTASAIERARHGEQPQARDLRGLNEALSAAPLCREVVRKDGALHAVSRRTGHRGTQVAAELADAAVDLLTDPCVTKVHRCEAPWCILLFLPAHPNRRWCSPTICGNRVRVGRYHDRRKSDRTE